MDESKRLQDQLLTTKFFVPAPSHALISRARLFALLNTWVGHSEPQLLVLDDYHVITEPALHASLTSFIERLPPQIHVVLISRVDPPFKLSRLRGHDQVFEVRTDSLRYTPEETDA